MAGVTDDIKRIYAESNSVGKYVLIMVSLFIALRILMFTNVPLDQWLSLPQRPEKLLTRPWTIFTYMFVHVDTRHIFYNLILLWAAGRIFTDLLGEKRFIKTYWLGGIAGGLLFLAVYNLKGDLNLMKLLLARGIGCCACCAGGRYRFQSLVRGATGILRRGKTGVHHTCRFSTQPTYESKPTLAVTWLTLAAYSGGYFMDGR